MTSPSDAGLQAERSGLAWSRTSLAVAANAVLLAARQLTHAQVSVALVPASMALLVALATAAYGAHRTRVLRHAPLPRPLAARGAVLALGWSVVVLAVVSGVVLAVER
ncbi:DUF202 domain-containing protein [Actinomycetospora sp. TBRC 11914]|uniref:DUF202 domain-containing protein n=1 Tax=Actinomycetospora sp. TBRC 11914 TaxID=2729387 RepID=UPI00145F85E8|nr:DUF202 domain-containing protein [Actinomycetospora sp. TBRC 11914]NMO89134.1 DUF202 domain-containing protein [Actinomycetospora sp. TBRC 11914]